MGQTSMTREMWGAFSRTQRTSKWPGLQMELASRVQVRQKGLVSKVQETQMVQALLASKAQMWQRGWTSKA